MFVLTLQQLPELPLLARLANKSHTIEPDLVPVAVATVNVENEAGDVLELDIVQPYAGRAPGVPIARGQRNGLRRRGIVRLAEIEVAGPVGVQIDDGWPH